MMLPSEYAQLRTNWELRPGGFLATTHSGATYLCLSSYIQRGTVSIIARIVEKSGSGS